MYKFNSINKYTDACQKLLGSKTKPEPWMHVAVLKVANMPEDKELGIKAQEKPTVYWAIYVWDTRKVLEVGEAKSGPMDAFANYRARNKGVVRIPKAIDSLEQVPGNGQIINAINRYVFDDMMRRSHRSAPAAY